MTLIKNGEELGRLILEQPRYVATCMARICRFGGQIPISVLVHSCILYEMVRRAGHNDRAKLWALLHDCHEVITGDVTRGCKHRELREQQDTIDDQLLLKIGVEFSGRSVVAEYDQILGLQESTGDHPLWWLTKHESIEWWANEVTELIQKVRVR